MGNYQTVCRIDDLSAGKSRVFSINDVSVGVFNVGGEFYAIEDHCPHAGASLALGSIEGDVVRCRIHHWGFCLRDGVYADENNPTYNARSFPVRIVDDQVQVCIDRS
jgi:nitrite reductase/ring-hydroxylating ferredoxin subunit